MDEEIIPVARGTYSSKRVGLSGLVLAAGPIFILSWVTVPGEAAEPTSRSNMGVEVVSPGPVVSFEGKLQAFW